MLLQFKVISDSTYWMIDTVGMKWSRSAGNENSSKIEELGKLIFIGLQGPMRVFALEGRDPKTEGPGNGLCTFGYALIDLDTTAIFYVQANVPIDELISRRPIETVKYELIPVNPENGQVEIKQ